MLQAGAFTGEHFRFVPTSDKVHRSKGHQARAIHHKPLNQL
jgi:hypothetical protein